MLDVLDLVLSTLAAAGLGGSLTVGLVAALHLRRVRRARRLDDPSSY